jgi:hypothetical protein
VGFDLWYIDEVYRHGGGPLLDVVTVHPYTGHGRGWIEQDVAREYQNLRELLKRHGDESKPVWFTESGFTNQCWITPLLDVQARFLVQQNLLTASWGLTANQVSYFYLKEHGFENWFLMRSDNSLLTAAAGQRNLAQQTHGLSFDRLLDVGRNRVGMVFKGPDRQVSALFSYDFQTTADLQTDAAQATLIDFFGNESSVTSRQGRLEVPISGYPVYLRFDPEAHVAGVAADWGENRAVDATVRASSGQATATQVVDGVVTANGDHNGVPGWVSDKQNELPQWVEVTLPREERLARVLVYTNSSFSGVAGPRDFDVQMRVQDDWKTIARERGNVDRWVFEYPIEPTPADRIRVVVHRVNNGGLRDDPRPYADLTARISEIEAYAQ